VSHKTLRAFAVKDADLGMVTAVFSTLGVKDCDGDVTMPGAFEDGAEVVISAYGHTSWEGELPVGKGTIREVGTEVVLDGQFFLDTEGGKETFAVVKQLGAKGEWSYGYEPVEYSFGEQDGEHVRFLTKLKVFEVSPVLRGAGVNTRTLSAKAAGLRFGEHLASVLADVQEVAGRAADVMALRTEKGKSLSGESTVLVGQIDAALKALRDALSATEQDDAARDAEAQKAAREVLLRGIAARRAG